MLLGSTVMSAYAQLPEKGDWKTRVGIKAPEQVPALMQAVFNNPPLNDPFAPLDSLWYMSFYENYKKLTDYAPYADYTFYSGAFSETQTYTVGKEHRLVPDGTSIYERLIEAIPDTAMKMVIVEDILSLGRNIIDNLDSINVLRSASVKNSDDTLSLPVAMTMYAHLYYKYAGNPKYYPAHLYDKEQARENYRKAFRMLVDNNIDPGEELQAFYVREYYLACEDLYKSDKERYYEQFLQDYLDIVEACDNLLLPYIDNIKVKDDKYENYKLITDQYRRVPVTDTVINGQRIVSQDSIIIPYGIKTLFPLTGALDPDYMSKYYLAKLSAHRRNHDYMENALYIMNELDANKTEAYYSYSEASYAIKPTYLNCLGCAFSSKECDMQEDMHDFYRQAVDITQDSLKRGLVYYYISEGIEPQKCPNSNRESEDFLNWNEEMSVAVNYLDKVVNLSSYFLKDKKLELRELPSHSAFKIHQIRYWTAHAQRDVSQCDEAIQYIYKCDELYPGLYPNLNSSINRVNVLEGNIKSALKNSKKPKSKNNGPRMSTDDQKQLYAAARIATEEIFNAGKKANVSKLNAYDQWWRTYMNSPDLTERHKSDRRNYENVKRKYYD